MHKKSMWLTAFAAGICLLAAACGGGPGAGGDKDVLVFEGLLLHETSVLVTASKEQQLPKGSLISLDFPGEIIVPAAGSLYQYEIEPALRESWPVQGSVRAAEEIEALAGPTLITLETGEAILQHLSENAWLIDVRTPQEYESGYVSGALNIPVDQIEAAILTAVPEKADVVILYCRSGNRSAQAADILEDLGYLVILDAGGINSYKGELVL